MKKETLQPVIQEEVLDKLRLLNLPGEPDLLAELATFYFETTPGRILRMRQHLEKRNLDSLGREAHILKSSSGNLGAHRLVSLCQEIESAARTAGANGADEMESLIEKIERLDQEYLLAASHLVNEMKTSNQGG